MNTKTLSKFVDGTWDDSIVPTLHDYIAIPAQSPLFDPDWQQNGHIDRAMDLISGWCGDQPIPGMKMEVVRLEGRTPLLLMEIPGQIDETVLLYGHMDKQPPMTGWDADLGPWKPVMRDGKLYGRGGADDGYAAFASLTAIRALQEQGIPHGRCVVLIEGCEESGSIDLPFYIDALADRIGTPSLVVCLDSGCGNYDQLWCTTSLRGIVVGSLTVKILREGVHSGAASGIVASTFRIARQLLSRVEDEVSGKIHVKEFHAEVPNQRQDQIKAVAKVLGDAVYKDMPFLAGAKPVAQDLNELILNNTWRPTVSITGADGIPSLANAGNVMRPETSLKISLRLPPTVDAFAAANRLQNILQKNPPYGADVKFEIEGPGNGWNAPALAPWLGESLSAASMAFFGKPACHMGEGGSIPFMSMLGERYPKAQFMITGVLGPQSNAHGPNEFLHIGAGKRLTACVSKVLSDHYTTFSAA